MWFTILGFLNNLPWLKIGIGAALLTLVIYGMHLVRQNEALTLQTKTLQESLQIQQKNYEKSMSVVVIEKNAAIMRAKTVGQQLEVIRNAKSIEPNDAVLANTLEWLRNQPDPYNDQPNTSGAVEGFSSTCHRVSNQTDAAKLLVGYHSALEQCRSQLEAIRKLQ